jgi:hypothetical protein
VGAPTLVPAVWSFGSRMMFKRGNVPDASYWRNSSSQLSTRLASVMSRSQPA